MTWVYGVDMSYEELTLEEALRLKAAGVAVVAQCLWTGAQQPPPRVTNLRNALFAQLATIGYISVAPAEAGNWHVLQARTGVPDDIWKELLKTPIDVELEGLHYDRHVLSALNQAVALGKPQDVYTNWNTWVTVLGNPTRPDGCGLWNAYWDGAPDIDFASLPFGRWTLDEVWGEQWSGGTYVEGQYVDRNQFRSELLQLSPPHTTPAPTPPNAPAGPNLKAVAQLHRQIAIELER